jgi:crotonobetainyl-CoA:carnitine CoA-transferase CaiB-like acyl-CoA transferase
MQVLDSIRVVELTEALAGPYCAMMLGDFGADVIKVERRQKGDQSRSWGPPFVGSESAYFLAANRNKRSLSLDYDQPLGAAILHRLLATADVFLMRRPFALAIRDWCTALSPAMDTQGQSRDCRATTSSRRPRRGS